MDPTALPPDALAPLTSGKYGPMWAAGALVIAWIVQRVLPHLAPFLTRRIEQTDAREAARAAAELDREQRRDRLFESLIEEQRKTNQAQIDTFRADVEKARDDFLAALKEERDSFAAAIEKVTAASISRRGGSDAAAA